MNITDKRIVRKKKSKRSIFFEQCVCLSCSSPQFACYFYGSIVWANNYPTRLDKLLKLQTKALRVIKFSTYKAPALPLLQKPNLDRSCRSFALDFICVVFNFAPISLPREYKYLHCYLDHDNLIMLIIASVTFVCYHPTPLGFFSVVPCYAFPPTPFSSSDVLEAYLFCKIQANNYKQSIIIYLSVSPLW